MEEWQCALAAETAQQAARAARRCAYCSRMRAYRDSLHKYRRTCCATVSCELVQLPAKQPMQQSAVNRQRGKVMKADLACSSRCSTKCSGSSIQYLRFSVLLSPPLRSLVTNAASGANPDKRPSMLHNQNYQLQTVLLPPSPLQISSTSLQRLPLAGMLLNSLQM